jgi:hypothetical protein
LRVAPQVVAFIIFNSKSSVCKKRHPKG